MGEPNIASLLAKMVYTNLRAIRSIRLKRGGAAARLEPIPAEEQREVLSGNDVPGYEIACPLAWARGASTTCRLASQEIRRP